MASRSFGSLLEMSRFFAVVVDVVGREDGLPALDAAEVAMDMAHSVSAVRAMPGVKRSEIRVQ